MFEVITTYTVENDVDIMGLRAELSYMIRKNHGDDTHLVRSILQGEKTYITLVYTNVNENVGMELQHYADGYMVNDKGVLVFDHLESDVILENCNRHWLYDAINLIGGDDGKVYSTMKDMLIPDNEYEDVDIVVAYNRARVDTITKLYGLWDGMWMKGIGSFYNRGWPIEQGERDDWFQVKEHLPRVMGNFYEFYSRRLRGNTNLTFRIPYNFSIIHEICRSLPEHKLSINGGYLTVHDNLDKYDDIMNVSRVVEDSILVRYKTCDYWGDDIGCVLTPWSQDFSIQTIRINGSVCYLARIPNVVSVDDGRKMIAYMLQEQVKVK